VLLIRQMGVCYLSSGRATPTEQFSRGFVSWEEFVPRGEWIGGRSLAENGGGVPMHLRALDARPRGTAMAIDSPLFARPSPGAKPPG